MDVHRIGVHLALHAGGFAQGMQMVMGHLVGMQTRIQATQANLNALGRALYGFGALAGGAAIMKSFEPLFEAGARLEHFRTQLKAAGYDAQQVGKAMSAAWKEAGNNMNTGVADNLKNIHHIANITGNIDEARALLPTFNLAEAALSSLKDEHVKGKIGAGERQTYNFARALEELGITATRPGETSHDAEERVKHYAQTALKGIIAMRGLVDGGSLYTAIQNSGGSQLKWSEDFFGHELFPLIQTFGQRAGNMGYMINAQLVQGRMTTAAAQAMAKYGLVPDDPEHMRYDKIGRIIGVKPGAMPNSKLLDENWPKWFRDVFVPHLATREPGTGRALSPEDAAAGKGIHTDAELNAAIDEMFRNKTVAVASRYASMIGSRTAMLKERANIDRVPDDAVGIMQGDDPSLVYNAFHQQWGNLMTALGHPEVASGIGMLKELNVAIKDLAQTASMHPTAVKVILGSVAALAAGLVAIGTVLIGGMLLGAMGPAGWLVLGIAALGGAVAAIRPGIFKEISAILNTEVINFERIGTAIKNAIDYVFKQMAIDIVNAIKGLPGAIFGGHGGAPNDPAAERQKMREFFFGRPGAGGDNGMTFVPDGFGGGSFQKQNWLSPGGGGGQPLHTRISLNIDGHRIADAVAYQIARRLEESHSAGPVDGSMHPHPVELYA